MTNEIERMSMRSDHSQYTLKLRNGMRTEVFRYDDGHFLVRQDGGLNLALSSEQALCLATIFNGSIETPLQNGYYFFTCERASEKAIAQYINGCWHLIGEGSPVTIEELNRRGWQLGSRIDTSDDD